MRGPTQHIFDHTPDSLAAWCDARGMPVYRASQILEWVYRRGVIEPEAMTNLPKALRAVLASEMAFESGHTVATQRASDGVRKLLIEWEEVGAPGDDRSLPVLGAEASRGSAPARQTECVMIPAGGETDERPSRREGERASRRTACISSQVGCPVGCRFCASGLGGLDGNLSAGRIVEQVWRLDRLVRTERDNRWRERPAPVNASPRGSNVPPPPNERGITNVVFMGMGEPLANFQSVMRAVRTLAAPWGMHLSARKITISTVGLHVAIEKLADELEVPVTLALSLHAPNDALRRELIPWAEFTSIEQLLVACDRWFAKTGREITLEYTLLRGVNDTDGCAAELAEVARRLRSNVNLIRFNEVDGVPFERPQDSRVRAVQKILRDRGVNAHIRASRGRDIAAACGQLRHETAAPTR
ncbi:MAG: 23S rRNA (adenine(2503)-C(2))-methyltransferase RlmN [Planctomycetota bacterium]